MKHPWLVIIGMALPTLLVAQTARSPEAHTERGPFARIAIMRALDGHSVENHFVSSLESINALVLFFIAMGGPKAHAKLG